MKSPVTSTETRILVTRNMNCVAFERQPLFALDMKYRDDLQRDTGESGSSFEDVVGSC